jgi:hypothetical protein
MHVVGAGGRFDVRMQGRIDQGSHYRYVVIMRGLGATRR